MGRDTSHRYRTALHEAAHAVAAETVGCSVSSVELDPPEREWAGVCRHRPADLLEDDALIKIAPAVALARLGESESGCRKDRANLDSARLRLDDRRERESLPGFAWLRYRSDAARLVDERWPDILRVADALLAAGTLTGDEVRAVLGTASVEV
jgi:hypothetical protein